MVIMDSPKQCEAQFDLASEPEPEPETTTVPTSPTVPTYSGNYGGVPACSTFSGTINASCNASGQTVTNLEEIEEGGQVANATIDRPIISKGWFSNGTIGKKGIVSGGIATGYLKVEGRLEDFVFVGASVTGLNEAGEMVGTLGGTIYNKSKVGGDFQNVFLAPNTSITGGILKKTITGYPLYPALLEELTVSSGTQLDNVIIGRQVELAKEVSLGAGVEFVMPGMAIDKGGKATSSQTGFLSHIRTDKKRHANGIKLTTSLASTLQIEEQLFIETKHVGQSAELLIVAYHKKPLKTTVYMRAGEKWKVWNSEFTNLEAATQYERLPKKIEVLIFEGDLSELLGELTIYSDIPLFLYYSLSDKYFGRSRRPLAWFCQTKVWTPFSESLYVASDISS
jgi:hypothetical protein